MSWGWECSVLLWFLCTLPVSLVFLCGPGSCCGAAEHRQQPSISTHTAADSAWPHEKETIWSRGLNAVYLAVNGNLCWPQWKLDLILCLLECFGVGCSFKWLFFRWLISGSFFSLFFLKCIYLRVVENQDSCIRVTVAGHFYPCPVSDLVSSALLLSMYWFARFLHGFPSFFEPFHCFSQTLSITLKPLLSEERNCLVPLLPFFLNFETVLILISA